MKLKELAALLDLSPTTVSRALNGYPEVAEETRARVRAAADRAGYTPNARARSLATGRAMAIGHVLPRSDRHEMVNPVFGDFVAGASETYSRRGYDLLLSLVDDTDEEQTYRNLAARGTVDGLMVHGPRVSDPRITLLRRLNIPFVVHGRAGDDKEYSWLDVDNRRAFARAAGLLIDLGHRRIGLVNGRETMDFASRRRQGFLSALAERGLEADPALMRAGEMTESHGYSAAAEMLARPDPPTAFLVSSMICALGVRRAIEERGQVMGRDVSVVTHDDALSYLETDETVPLFTATRSSVSEAGRRAAALLIDRIENPGRPPDQVLLEAELRLGRSTGPPPGVTPARAAAV